MAARERERERDFNMQHMENTKFTFIHLADTFIQSDLQLRNTISDTL